MISTHEHALLDPLSAVTPPSVLGYIYRFGVGSEFPTRNQDRASTTPWIVQPRPRALVALSGEHAFSARKYSRHELGVPATTREAHGLATAEACGCLPEAWLLQRR